VVMVKRRGLPATGAAVEPYADNLEYLLASLALLDLRLLAEVQRVRLLQGAETGEFRGCSFL
jgi:hypothetical protein